MKLQKTVVADKPLDAVFGYLSDFTTTTDWDPGTVVTVNHHGDGGVGTTYLNTSTFLGRQTQLTYIVREFVPGQRIRLRGQNKTVTAVDTMTFRSIEAGTEVTYTAELTLKGPARLLTPLLRPAFERLGKQAQNGMHNALNQLRPAGPDRPPRSQRRVGRCACRGGSGGRSPDHHAAWHPGTARCHAHARRRARTSLVGVVISAPRCG